MNDLPRGTVTFLFTDIEGSTKLWQQFPDAMPAALARHHEILQRAIELHNGYVFQIIGDAFCAAFATAFDGLDAALEAQRALRDEGWGETGAIRVRMALHTGAADVRAGEFTSGEYVSGITLSRAARLLSAGHGGQILLSSPSAELVREQLPPHTALRDMGALRLKDLVQPQQIFQILANDLAQDFPPLKTLDALPNNLPIQLTSFIGREREIREIKHLLTGDGGQGSDSCPPSPAPRLLTLTGTGGSGKTRLSLQVAAEVIDEFEKGAWLVELAPLADASLVPNAVMSALGLREEAGRAPLEALTDFLRAKKLLLVLDNCEHLIEACAQLAHQLLTQCPNLKILATSREPLGIAGEVTYQVPSLALPDPKHLPSLEALSQYDAVRLFIERAISVQQNFSVTNTNAPAVAQICFRLDGIPLALELAAARIKLFSPEQIALRLDDRFRLLTGGSRAAMPRQQTLRAAIEWSYSLLSEQERILFRRLAVFAGGWTFEAAEQVCANVGRDGISPYDVLDTLAQLVNKSLVTTEARGDETRYRMLETIREFAVEKLRAAGETENIRTRHLEFFVSLAEQAEPHLKRAEQLEWLERLDAELDNVRAGLTCAVTNRDFESGARLVSALEYFWMIRAYGKEAYEWAERILEVGTPNDRTRLRAKFLRTASIFGNEIPTTRELAFQRAKEGLAIARELGDARGIAQGLDGLAQNLAKADEKLPLRQERLLVARGLGDKWVLGDALNDLAWETLLLCEDDQTNVLLEEGLSLAREVGDRILLGAILNNLAFLLTDKGHYEPGMKLVIEQRELFQQLGFRAGVADSANWLAMTAHNFGDYPKARHYMQESIQLYEELGAESFAVGLSQMLGHLGLVEIHERGNLELATEYIEKAYKLALGAQRIMNLGNSNFFMGHLALHKVGPDRAVPHMRESIVLYSQINNVQGVLMMVHELGVVSAQTAVRDSNLKHAERATQLFGAAQAGLERLNLWMSKFQQEERDEILPALRALLGEQEFESAWNVGRALTYEQAIELALRGELPTDAANG